jgi:hypothetical protein
MEEPQRTAESGGASRQAHRARHDSRRAFPLVLA